VTDELRLRAAYGELLAARAPESRAPESRADCAPPEALLALAERAGSEEERLATLDHVMGCLACRRELDLLRASLAASVETSAGAAPVTPLEARRAWRGFPLRPLVIAAGIVVVVGVGVITRREADVSPTLRGGANELALAPPHRRTDGGVVLRWRRIAEVPRYRVEVFAPSGVTVAEGIVADTTFAVPSGALAGQPDTLRWMVTALRPDGGELRSTMGRIAP
jgi:hypothetical protein